MSSGFQSDGSGDRPSRETDPPADNTSRNEHQELLDQVLQATLSLGGENEPLSPEELRTLKAVAQRQGEEPLSVETMTELVQTVLKFRFRTLADSRNQWDRMTRQIAETMINDPQALQRLQNLWILLREAAP